MIPEPEPMVITKPRLHVLRAEREINQTDFAARVKKALKQERRHPRRLPAFGRNRLVRFEQEYTFATRVEIEVIAQVLSDLPIPSEGYRRRLVTPEQTGLRAIEDVDAAAHNKPPARARRREEMAAPA